MKVLEFKEKIKIFLNKVLIKKILYKGLNSKNKTIKGGGSP